MTDSRTVRIAVNGYGVIGKRVADAVADQKGMTLAGVADVVTDWRAAVARAKGYPLYGAEAGGRREHRALPGAGYSVHRAGW
jgi:glyceraldehyde-3-phosphate dehydrogenase (NAD(P))